MLIWETVVKGINENTQWYWLRFFSKIKTVLNFLIFKEITQISVTWQTIK